MDDPKERDTKVIIKTFARQIWRDATAGTLAGAAAGLCTPSIVHLYAVVQPGTLNGSHYIANMLARPKHAWEIAAIIIVCSALLCANPTHRFLRRMRRSWRAGLMTGTGTIWFLASGIAFGLLALTGSELSLLALTIGVGASGLAFWRDTAQSALGPALPDAETDAPIKRQDEDILGRGAVVDSLLRTIVADGAPIVALTGTYGDGKTSVLNLLSNALESRQPRDVICVRFSPWLPADEKTLISSLLSSVLDGLEEILVVPRIKRDLATVMRLLVSVVPHASSTATFLFRHPSQDEQIDKLRRHLAKLPVRVAILLDDLDRLRRDELQTLLKLLRGVPEFPQFTYICALHRESLAQILSATNAPNDIQRTYQYMEKFFCDEIPLPKIEPSQLAVEFEKRFYKICNENDLLLDLEERRTFKESMRIVWQRSLRTYFTNLRRIKLATNRLRRSIPLVKDEVNLKDFLLLEIVRVIEPVLYEQISRNAPYFMFTQWKLTSSIQDLHADPKLEQEKRNNFYSALFRDIEKPPEGAALGALREIFPMVDAFFRGTTVSGSISRNPELAERERRVFHPDFFQRYFIFNVPADLFGEQETNLLLKRMNSTSQSNQCANLLQEKYSQLQDLPMKRWDMLNRLRLSLEKLNAPAADGVATAIANLSEQLEMAEEQGHFDAITAARIIFGVANQLEQIRTGAAQKILNSVIQAASSDMFATKILNECEHKHDRWLRADISIELGILKESFRQRMAGRYAYQQDSPFLQRAKTVSIVPLGRWALCGPEGKRDVHGYLSRQFLSEPWKAARFLTNFFPGADGPPIPLLTAIETYFPTQELLKILEVNNQIAKFLPEEKEAYAQFQAAMQLRRKNE